MRTRHLVPRGDDEETSKDAESVGHYPIVGQVRQHIPNMSNEESQQPSESEFVKCARTLTCTVF